MRPIGELVKSFLYKIEDKAAGMDFKKSPGSFIIFTIGLDIFLRNVFGSAYFV